MAGKSKVSRLLTAGKRAARDPPLHHALVAVYQFQLGETQQVLRVVHVLGGILRGHPPVFPEKAGQLQLLQMVFQQQRRPVVHAALPDSKGM